MSNLSICYEYGDPASRRILIQPVDPRDLAGMEAEAAAIAAIAGPDFRLIAVKIEDWNRDLSPWAAPPVFGKAQKKTSTVISAAIPSRGCSPSGQPAGRTPLRARRPRPPPSGSRALRTM